jgi:hypothetical protein
MFLLHVYVKLHRRSRTKSNEATQINNKMRSLSKLQDGYFSCFPAGSSSSSSHVLFLQPV